MNLEGALATFKKSDDALGPIFEAITNSLEAIATKTFEVDEKPNITVTLDFSGSEDGLRNLQAAIIRDNGVGFTGENYGRFVEFIDRSKGFNNRGTGRIQFLHRFEVIRVESVFLDDGVARMRSFSVDPASFITKHRLIDHDDSSGTFSEISMLRPIFGEKDRQRFEQLDAEALADQIRQKYLLRFFLDEQNPEANVPEITIIYLLNGQEVSRLTVWDEALPEPASTGSLSVSYSKVEDINAEKPIWLSVEGRSEEIKWAQFKISADKQQKNRIHLCSKNVAVEKIPFGEIKVNDVFDGDRFLTFFYGDVFDRAENVSDSVDAFTFPEKSQIERSLNDLFADADQEYLFSEDLFSSINAELERVFNSVIEAKKQNTAQVEAIAFAHAIPESVVKRITVTASDTEKSITTKLFEEQGRQQATKAYEAKRIVESLKELNPTEETYQDELAEKIAALSKLVDQQNKEELGRYVIRREMVAVILQAILTAELSVQITQDENPAARRDTEGLVHDLIFKRKSTTASLNDLWILNEEFLHFDGTSDVPINQIEDEAGNRLLRDVTSQEIEQYGLRLTRRPDIYLFLKEGKCVLIELKAPTVDVSDYLNQLPKYCSLIANYSQRKIDTFFCYLIGEDFNALTDLNDYERTVSGDYIRQNMPVRSVEDRDEVIARQQIEIIKLSSLYDRASRRNKSFADKLGVRVFFE